MLSPAPIRGMRRPSNGRSPRRRRLTTLPSFRQWPRATRFGRAACARKACSRRSIAACCSRTARRRSPRPRWMRCRTWCLEMPGDSFAPAAAGDRDVGHFRRPAAEAVERHGHWRRASRCSRCCSGYGRGASCASASRRPSGVPPMAEAAEVASHSRGISRSARSAVMASATGASACWWPAKPRCSPTCCSPITTLALPRNMGWVLEPRPTLKLALPNTVLLLASSVVAWFGERGVSSTRRAARRCSALECAFVMGAVFAVVQLRMGHQTLQPRHLELCLPVLS